MDRRDFLGTGLRVAAGAALLGAGAPSLLAACSSSSGSVATSGTPGVSTQPPRRGGKLTIGVGSEVNGFDPSSSDFDATGYLYANTVFDPLTALDSNGKPAPYLAQSVEPNQDYSVWTIGLRPGIMFHDGTPLDAAAVKLNLDDRRTSALVGPALSNISDVSVVDPMTVRITMSSPWVPFAYYLSVQPGFIVSPRMIANKSGAASHPVGTGPFVFREWVPNDHFTATRNPHYWRPGLPYLDQIEYRPIIDSTAIENTLKSGGIDVLTTGYPSVISDVRADSSLVTVDDSKETAVIPAVSAVMLNTAVPPFDDIRARQALAYATNNVQGTAQIAYGVFQPAFGPFPPGNPYYAEDSGYPRYDPRRAQELVNQYVRDKGPLSFQLYSTNVPYVLEVVQLLQSNWKSFGIDAHISQTEQTTLIIDALQGHFQATIWAIAGVEDPDENYVWWSSQTVAPVGQFSLNFSRNKDPQLEAALQAGRTESDPASRIAAYQEVARRLNQDLPYIWLSRDVSAVSAQPHVMNFNNPTLPDGSKGYPMTNGVFSTTAIWLS